MTKAEKEMEGIRGDLSEGEWAVAQAILKIPAGRLITYRCLSQLALGYDASRSTARLRRKLYGLLGHGTKVPLHRIAKQGDLNSCHDSVKTRRENNRRRLKERTPLDDSAWWCPEGL